MKVSSEMDCWPTDDLDKRIGGQKTTTVSQIDVLTFVGSRVLSATF